MTVKPTHAAVGHFFKIEPMFRIPKYQRGYSWEKAEIDDFIEDLTNCFRKRKANTPANHFFGGIFSVEHDVPGVSTPKAFELVDGQQRMATFVILISSIISLYKELLLEAKDASDAVNERIIASRIEFLTVRFIEFQQESNRVFSTVPVIILSKADNDFFRNLVRQHPSTPSRNSHKRMAAAYSSIHDSVKNLITATTLNDKIDNLEIFNKIIDTDMSMIHIVAQDKSQAYTLFRVLNDRGKSLTEGDLLRARVLELLEGHDALQAACEDLWDDILADEPSTTEKFFKWIFISHTGRRADTNSFVDDFAKEFYGTVSQPLNATDAQKVVQASQTLSKDIENCRQLMAGEWPFTRKRPIEAWDVSRLGLLIKELNVTVVIPLLLSATKLDDRKFSEVVQMLERFMFRFKSIGKLEIGPLNTIIYSHSKNIRNNTSTYATSSLKADLHTLQVATVSDDTFKTLLGNLEYKAGGSNQISKYFLMTLEYYRAWHKAGATGEPKCIDKTRNYDFNGSTLEHIYPRNAKPAGKDINLEQVKNNLGNLTFMGPTENNAGSNDDFATKKPIFVASSVAMNTEIGALPQWTISELNTRLTELKTMACTVFNI